MHAAIQQIDQPFERRDADARIALRQHVGAKRHHRADGAHRQRIVDARGMAAKEIELELAERVLRDRDFRQRSEAGVDPVHRRVTLRLPVHHIACRRDRRDGAPRDRDRRELVRDRGELLERQRFTIELDHQRVEGRILRERSV